MTFVRIISIFSACAMVLVLAAIPAHAAFPGKKGQIAYRAGANYIYLTDTGQLTFPAAGVYDFAPAFSPDGSEVAFVRQNVVAPGTYFYQVLAVRPDGTGLRSIANSNAFPGLTAFFSIMEPAWTPTGEVSFIVRNGTDAQNGIWMGGSRIVAEKSSTGQSWSPVGKRLVYGCSFRKDALNRDAADLCTYDAIKDELRQLPIDWPGKIPNGIGTPRWTPDGERIVFQMGYTVDTSDHHVEHYDIFSVSATGGKLTRLTNPGADICPTETNSKSTYYWQTPSPAPDGTNIVTYRWTNVRSGTSGCNTLNQEKGLYTVSGGLLQSIPNQTSNTDWQPIPVDLVVAVEDGHGNPLEGLKVELLTTDHVVLVTHPDSSGGDYFFNGVTPNDYLVRISLTDDSVAPAFDIRHSPDPSASDKPVWIEYRIKVPVGSRIFKKIPFENSPAIAETGSNVIPQDRDRLDDMANIYFRMRQFVDWVKATIEPDTGPLLPIHTYVEYDPVRDVLFASDNARYYCNSCSDGYGPMIFMGTKLSDFALRDGASNEAPENGEWHEYVHHLYATHIGRLSCAEYSAEYKNHAGYANEDTCDSLDEGFASFLPTLAAHDISGVSDSFYDALWDLEENTRAWDLRTRSSDKTLVNAEDKAVAALFWDLNDTNPDIDPNRFIGADGLHHDVTWADTISVPIASLWALMKAEAVKTVHGLRQAFGAPQPTIDLDNDQIADIAPLDELFLMHGFFPIDMDQAITAGHSGHHYDVRYAGSADPPIAARNGAVGLTNHLAIDVAGVVTRAYPYRTNIQYLPAANIDLTVQDATGKPLSGAEVSLDMQSGVQQSTSTRRLGSGSGELMNLELPTYFDYLLPEDAELPPCDPASARRVDVTVTVSVNGFPSLDVPTSFDNCAWMQAVDAATGPAALALTTTLPEDSTAPVSTLVTTPTDELVGSATLGAWIIALRCDDPEESGFASGCARLEYRLDSGPVTVYQHSLSVEEVGTHLFEYQSVDAAANEEGFQSVTLEIAAGPPPAITDFTPAYGAAGALVTITGTNLDRTSAVDFNGTAASFSVTSATALDATVPAGATSGPIMVTAPGGSAASATDFVVVQPPGITGFAPAFGNVGSTLVITGAGFTYATGVDFAGTNAGYVIDSDTQITAIVPAGAVSGAVAVTNPAGTATSNADFIVTVGPPPVITSFSPDSGSAGTSVTIKGDNLSGATFVTFNGVAVDNIKTKGSALAVSVPAGASTGLIAVTTPGGTAVSDTSFVVPVAPEVTGFSPDSGPPGSTVTVTGSHFTGTSQVKIDGSNTKFTVDSDTTITVNIAKGTKSGPVSVTTPGGTATSTGTFTVIK